VSRSENRLFFPQSALDDWIVDGSVEFEDGELVILSERRRYELTEAVRVLDEVSGGGDTHELSGRVRGRVELERLGAEIVESSMLLGDSAYDTVPGWFGVPVGLTLEAKESAKDAAASAVQTEEEVLLSFVAKTAGS
jgi:hypothetical protein